MSQCRRALAGLSALVVVGFVVGLAAQQAPAKGNTQQKKVDKARQAEASALLKLANQVEAGQPAPSDVPLTISPAFLKGSGDVAYAPYTVSIDGAKLTTTALAGYLRIVKKGADKEVPAAEKPPGVDMVWVNLPTQIYHRMGDPLYGRGKDSKFMTEAEAQQSGAREARADERIWMPAPVFEDIYFLDIKSAAAGQKFRFARAFSVPAGDYDLYLALKERASGGKNPPKVTVLKLPLTVPNFWTNDLATSTIFLSDKVEQLPAPLNEQQQAEQPYTVGTMRFTPTADAKFTKKDNLGILFLVYNTGVDANKKPDVTVEYSFYQKMGESSDKFFNKTDPQVFNAQTLPANFDPTIGRQFAAGQEVPLSSFSEGAWRVEIKIFDKINNKTLTQSVPFTIAG
jgi:hypothetical protein